MLASAVKHLIVPPAGMTVVQGASQIDIENWNIRLSAFGRGCMNGCRGVLCLVFMVCKITGYLEEETEKKGVKVEYTSMRHFVGRRAVSWLCRWQITSAGLP